MARSYKASVAYTLYHAFWSGLDLLLPPRCGGCEASGFRWCPDCAAQVQNPPEPVCSKCGVPLARETLMCGDCDRAQPGYRMLRSWSIFEGPIRKALHRLKYRRDLALGEALTPALSARVQWLEWPVDLVVPVPLGRKRLAERGYNQVNLIARPLAMALGIAYAPGALTRRHETRSQVGLSRAERQLNVRDAFRARDSRVHGRIILLMDDVATTGSTLSSCAQALYASGARDVFAFTVARALPRHGLYAV